MGTAEGSNPAPRLHLAKTAIGGRDHNITGEHHLYANRKDDALHGGDDRLAAAPLERELIKSALVV